MKENQLLNAAKLIIAINDNPDNQSHPIKLNPKAYEQLKNAISQTEWQEERNEDYVTLHIEDAGDSSVGIGRGCLEVKFYKGLVETPEDREELRRHFIEVGRQVDILQFRVRQSNFSDECCECNTILKDDKCVNKNCISNIYENEMG